MAVEFEVPAAFALEALRRCDFDLEKGTVMAPEMSWRYDLGSPRVPKDFSMLQKSLEITIKIDRYSKATSIGDPMTPTTL